MVVMLIEIKLWMLLLVKKVDIGEEVEDLCVEFVCWLLEYEQMKFVVQWFDQLLQFGCDFLCVEVYIE